MTTPAAPWRSIATSSAAPPSKAFRRRKARSGRDIGADENPMAEAVPAEYTYPEGPALRGLTFLREYDHG